MEAAREYHRRGWAAVPIPPSQKAAVMPSWPEFRAPADDLRRLFGRGDNIGVILGAVSGELVDVDLDCPEALALAPLYLPPTGTMFRRPSKPMSHRLCIALGAAYESFADPLTGKC